MLARMSVHPPYPPDVPGLSAELPAATPFDAFDGILSLALGAPAPPPRPAEPETALLLAVPVLAVALTAAVWLYAPAIAASARARMRPIIARSPFDRWAER